MKELDECLQQPDIEINCVGTFTLICPYCGKQQRVDHWELLDCEYDYMCAYCLNHFEYEREVVPLYTSKKIIE